MATYSVHAKAQGRLYADPLCLWIIAVAVHAVSDACLSRAMVARVALDIALANSW
jgi:hypothetical protein